MRSPLGNSGSHLISCPWATLSHPGPRKDLAVKNKQLRNPCLHGHLGTCVAASKLCIKSARTTLASSAFDQAWTETSTTFSVRSDVLMFGGGVLSTRLSCSRYVRILDEIDSTSLSSATGKLTLTRRVGYTEGAVPQEEAPHPRVYAGLLGSALGNLCDGCRVTQ